MRGWLAAADVLSEVEDLVAQPSVDDKGVGAFGFSIGAQASLRAAARSDRIRAVLADGPVASVFADEPSPVTGEEWLNYPAMWVFYQLLALSTGVASPPALVDVLADIAPRPLLLLSTGTGHEALQLRKLFAAAAEPKSLFEIPETGHGGGLRARPAEYAERLVTFFEANLDPAALALPDRPRQASSASPSASLPDAPASR